MVPNEGPPERAGRPRAGRPRGTGGGPLPLGAIAGPRPSVAYRSEVFVKNQLSS